ncbi:MAG TPA: 3'(2'),5'-bisphosphate nucleotidase CysQ [Alphaproteobacteria bacterium]|nr:3'(2'),5'-bisphosphate nucleotidase CysQ [Alphaproteobacteria bacterium]
MNNIRSDLESLTPKVVALAEEAGQLISRIYEEEVEIFTKEDGSPVTRADHQSHHLLKRGLEKLTPHIPVISEEDEESWAIKSPIYWLVDPLDGTKGFIQKSGEFCINIALMEENCPIFGLIHIPLTQETFYGYGKKAWQSLNGKIIPIQTRSRPHQGMTLLLGGYGKKSTELADFFLKSYPIKETKRIRSAIKFCHIASGRADLYLRFEPCSEWDTAAGQILVEAAGGIMTNLDGTSFIYGKPGLINEAFVVFGIAP